MFPQGDNFRFWKQEKYEGINFLKKEIILPPKVLVDVTREITDTILYGSPDPNNQNAQIQKLIGVRPNTKNARCERRIEDILFTDRNTYTEWLKSVGSFDSEVFSQILEETMFEVLNFEFGKKIANEIINHLLPPVKTLYFLNDDVFTNYIYDKYAKLTPYPNEHWQKISRNLLEFWKNIEKNQSQYPKKALQVSGPTHFSLWLHENIFKGKVFRSINWESLRYDECGNFYKKHPQGLPIWNPYYPYPLANNIWDKMKQDIRGIVIVYKLEVIAIKFPKKFEKSRGYITFKELEKRPSLEEIILMNQNNLEPYIPSEFL